MATKRTTKEPRLAPGHPLAPILDALETQRRNFAATPAPADVAKDYAEGLTHGRLDGLESAMTILVRMGAGLSREVLEKGQRLVKVERVEHAMVDAASVEERLRRLEAAVFAGKLNVHVKPARRAAPAILEQPAPLREGQPTSSPAAPKKAPRPDPMPSTSSLPLGETRVLTVIAQHAEGVTRAQITAITGYKRRTRDTYLTRLSSRDAIDTTSSLIVAKPQARELLGEAFCPLPTGSALLEHWLAELPAGEGVVLNALVTAYPEAMTRPALTEITGYKRRTRDTYVTRLKHRQLATADHVGVRASDLLFDKPARAT